MLNRNKKNNIALIIARSGSKRIKDKNILNFFGKPIFYYPFKAAKNSNLFKKIFLSTDSEEYAEIAKKNKINNIILRKKKLADSKTPIIDVIKDFIKNKKILNFENLCCIFGSAPLLDKNYLIESYKLFKKKKTIIFSSLEFGHPIQRSFLQKNDKLFFKSNFDRKLSTKFFDKYYHDAGQFYWGSKDLWLRKKNILNSKSFHFILPRNSVIDLDNYEDLDLAKAIFLKKNELRKSKILFKNY